MLNEKCSGPVSEAMRRRILFLDDHDVAAQAALTRVRHAARRHPSTPC